MRNNLFKKLAASTLIALMGISSVSSVTMAGNSASENSAYTRQDYLVNYVAVDEDGNNVDGVKLQYKSASDDKNTSGTTFVTGRYGYNNCVSPSTDVTTLRQSYTIDLSKVDPSVDADNIKYYKSFLTENKDDTQATYPRAVTNMTLSRELKFNTTYTLSVGYIDSSWETVTLPANTLACKNWGSCDNITNRSGVVVYEVGGDVSSSTCVGKLYPKANETEYLNVEAGKYNPFFHGGNLYGDDYIAYDKETEYSLVEVNIHDIYPKIFNEKGELILSESYRELLGTDSIKVGYGTYNGASYMAMACVISGGYSNIINPDENGMVKLYISKDLGYGSLQTGFSASSSQHSISGGGCSGSNGIFCKYSSIDFTTPAVTIPSTGTTFKRITPGEYTLSLVDTSEYTAEPVKFVVGDTDDVKTVKIVLKKKVQEQPTTEVPTTEAPTTVAPTTEVPTTESPTTEVPTTATPTTEAPTTVAPTTETKAGEVYADQTVVTTVTPDSSAATAPAGEVASDQTTTGDSSMLFVYIFISLAALSLLAFAAKKSYNK